MCFGQRMKSRSETLARGDYSNAASLSARWGYRECAGVVCILMYDQNDTIVEDHENLCIKELFIQINSHLQWMIHDELEFSMYNYFVSLWRQMPTTPPHQTFSGVELNWTMNFGVWEASLRKLLITFATQKTATMREWKANMSLSFVVASKQLFKHISNSCFFNEIFSISGFDGSLLVSNYTLSHHMAVVIRNSIRISKQIYCANINKSNWSCTNRASNNISRLCDSRRHSTKSSNRIMESSLGTFCKFTYICWQMEAELSV